ncbi:MAG TPA: hypothetical protein VGK45_11380, partial [Thermoanaerobaculia bacterium]
MRLLPEDHRIGWTPYVWLVYLGYFVIYPIMSRSLLEGALAVAGLAAFFVLYFWGHWLAGLRVLWSAAGIAALGVLFMPRNPGAGVFYVYAAAFCGRIGKTSQAVGSLLVLLAVVGVQSFALRMPFLAWFP